MRFKNRFVLKKFNISSVSALQFFQLARYGSFFLIGVMFSNTALGKTNIGHYETFLLIAGAFTFFWVNGFIKALLPLLTEKDAEQKKVLTFNAFLALFIFACISSVLMLVLNKPFNNYLLNGNDVPLPLVLALYIVVNCPAMLVEYIYLVNNRAKSILVYTIVGWGLFVVLVGLPPFLGYGLNVVLYCLIAASLIRFVWLLGVLGKYSKVQFDSSLMKEFLRQGAPLVLSTFLSSSASYIDGFIITSNFSPDDFAVFKYGARELPLSLLLANSLSMAMLPRFAQANIESPLAEMRSETFRLNWLLFPMTIVLIATSHWFYPLVFSTQFEASATIFNIYLLLIISRLLFPQTILTAKKINKTLVYASLFEIIINVTSSILLSQKFGIVGVAYGTFIAYVFEKIYLVVACKRLLNINIGNYAPLKSYISLSMATAAIFVIVEFLVY